MNQILSTENNNKEKAPKNKSELLDMRKIIIIFSVLLIVFALVIIVAKIYGNIKQNEQESPTAILNKPTIEIENVENICTLTVTYDEGLEKVTYWWNDEYAIERNMNGSTTPFITQIVIPQGDSNTLHVEATGIDGSSNQIEQTFGEGSGVDTEKPEISWYYQSGKIDIIAKSDKGIKNLTYYWEGEEPQTVSATETNQNELSITIDAKRGTNKIYIIATDIENNTQEKEVTIQGIYEPEINFYIENPRTLRISINHDMGFKKVIIKINDQEQVYDENSPQYSTEITQITAGIDLPPGRVNVEIRVYTLEEPEKEYYKSGWADIPE